MKPEDLIQRSPEWWAHRAAKVTASRVVDVIARNKPRKGQTAGDYTAARATYMKLIVAERLSGAPQGNGRVVRSLDERAALEPLARAAYEFDQVVDVRIVGFIDHPRIEFAGCSPDGLVGADGMVEFKVLDGAQHCELIQTGNIEAEYLAQMQFGLACSERAWCDFASYCPTMREEHKLWVRRIHRDDLIISQMEDEVKSFLAEVRQKLDLLGEL
jgi:hypothetical protein